MQPSDSDTPRPAEETGAPAPAGGQLGPAILPFVDGEPAGGDGNLLLCMNPSTGEPFGQVACATMEEIDSAVESAVLASSLWRGTSFEERGRYLLKLADHVEAQSETIAALISLEQGKPFAEALSQEILPALDHLRYVALHARDATSGEPIQPRHPLFAHKRAHYLYDPLGLVVVVTPFNLPFALPLIQVGAALAMGNAVLLKPSELTPLCGLRIGELCQEVGFPNGVVNVLPTTRDEALTVTTHPKVDKVFATGRLETGQQIMATAGCVPRPVVLALGGKHASIVASDADLERAVQGIVWGALSNSGQNCDAVERVYVEEPVASRFVDQLVKAVEKIRFGNPHVDDVDVGPLISDEHRRHVHRQVAEAVEGGGRLLCGGSIPPGQGYFYPPTVVLAPPKDCSLMREETLGPVIPVVIVESLERAILLANESKYSMSASGWTRSQQTAERLMAGLQAGTVTINDVRYHFDEPAAARAGHRMSGIGYFQGIAGLQEMCRRRFVSFDPTRASAPVFAFPYDAEGESLVRNLIRRLHGRGRARRLMALLRLVRQQRFRERIPFARFLFLSGRKLRG